MKKLIWGLAVMLAITPLALYARIDIKPGGVTDGDLIEYTTNVKDGLINRAIQIGLIQQTDSLTNSADIKLTQTLIYLNKGKLFTAAPANIDLSSLGANFYAPQVSGSYRKYLLSINSSGAVTTNAGLAVSGDYAELPAIVSGFTPFAYIKVQTSPTGSFTLGTTSFTDDAQAITANFKNLHILTSGDSGVMVRSDLIDLDTSSDSVSYNNIVQGQWAIGIDANSGNGPTGNLHVKDVFTLEPRSTTPDAEEGIMFISSAESALVVRINGAWKKFGTSD